MFRLIFDITSIFHALISFLFTPHTEGSQFLNKLIFFIHKAKSALSFPDLQKYSPLIVRYDVK